MCAELFITTSDATISSHLTGCTVYLNIYQLLKSFPAVIKLQNIFERREADTSLAKKSVLLFHILVL